jgi:hypothetical protein
LIPPSQSKVALVTPITAISADRISMAKKRVAEHRIAAAGIITKTGREEEAAATIRAISGTTTITNRTTTTTTTTTTIGGGGGSTTTASHNIAPLSTSNVNPSLNEFEDFDENISGACGF